MKIMVTGSNGQLGTDLVSLLISQGHTVIGADLPEVDITDESCIDNLIETSKPDAVVHLAAYTAVDKAEEEPDICAKVNVTGTRNIAKACGKRNIKVLYTSTDYVFDGSGDGYFETDSETGPLNVYGDTKLRGEKEILEYCNKYFIVRISWVFGVHGKNFVYTMIKLSETRDVLRVVDDQIGSPTFTPDLSKLILEMIQTEKYGIYHATNEEICSKAEFTREIVSKVGRNTEIVPVLTSEFPTPAIRPLNSRMSKKSLDEAGFNRLPGWKDALERFIIEYKTEN